MTRLAALPIVSLILSTAPGHAAVVASTTFDGQTISGNTASNLNWTLNGVVDPGSMAAFNATPAPQNLFDANSFVQNIFIPGINTGNGNTFWTTDVSLTVASGFAVTLTDVTFDYYAVNGGQVQNVNRRSDFTVTLLDPSSSVVDSVSIDDVVNGTSQDPGGNGTPVSLFFTAPIALSAPGTYTLRIQGGDYSGANETGNHTGINNLSINGDVVPEPSALALAALGFCGLLRRRRP